ncbi:hypothetical protein [Rathayibacter rathayi]|uniref:hypothetical protein n=2 Tax=Rathayibacter rathayi TaxID=33887 RepID=UPI0015E21088|nr:hypothetical protein [Rathayibacter rathayi]
MLEIMEMLAKIIPNGLVGLETGTNARNRENGSDRVAPDRRTDEQRHRTGNRVRSFNPGKDDEAPERAQNGQPLGVHRQICLECSRGKKSHIIRYGPIRSNERAQSGLISRAACDIKGVRAQYQ